MKSKIRGFTLIELLITVTVLMILSTFVFLTVGNSQKGARDNQRIANANNLMSALDQYASSNFRKYPTVANCSLAYCSQEITAGSTVATALASYINPVSTGSGEFKYTYLTNYDSSNPTGGTSYRQAAIVVSKFELDKNNAITVDGGKCNANDPAAALPVYLQIYKTANSSSVCYYVAR